MLSRDTAEWNESGPPGQVRDVFEGEVSLYGFYHALRPLLRDGQSAASLARPFGWWKHAGLCMRQAGGRLNEWRPDYGDYLVQRIAAGASPAHELASLLGINTSNSTPISFLAPGYVPAGMVTLLAGAGGSGKSTLAHELAVAVAGGERARWLGEHIEPAGAAYLIGGEDNQSLLTGRHALLDPSCGSGCVPVAATSPANFRAILSRMESLPDVAKPKLLVVDPARSFIEGSEDKSENISEFFGLLASFAERTGCAVVVVHHLAKNARPRNLEELRSAIRGSGVFVDRPRVVIGLYLHRDATWVGVVKHNIPGHQMHTEARPFLQDPVTLRLIPKDGATPPPRQPGNSAAMPATDADDGGDDLVLDTIKRLIGDGERVTRTKQRSLYARQLPALAGKSRAWIEARVSSLVEKGQLAMEEGAIVVAPIDQAPASL